MRNYVKKRAAAYTDEDVAKAYQSVKDGELSLRKAAEMYKIPKTTLRTRIKTGKLEKIRAGPQTVLSNEDELRLKEWILTTWHCGFSNWRLAFISEAARLLLEESKREVRFPDFGRHWYSSFNERHPQVRKTIGINTPHATWNFGTSELREWFHRIGDHLFEEGVYNITQQSERIFYCMQQNLNELNVLITFSASAQATPPLIVHSDAVKFDSVTLPKGWSKYTHGETEVDSTVLEHYLEHILYPYLQHVGIEFPIILFIEHQKKPPTLKLFELYKKLNIILINAYPMALHKLKLAGRERLAQWAESKPITEEDCTNFIEALKDTLVYKFTKADMKKAFTDSGLYLLDMNSVDTSWFLQTNAVADNKNAVVGEKQSQNTLNFSEFKRIVGPELFARLEESEPENGAVEFSCLSKIYQKFKNAENVPSNPLDTSNLVKSDETENSLGFLDEDDEEDLENMENEDN